MMLRRLLSPSALPGRRALFVLAATISVFAALAGFAAPAQAQTETEVWSGIVTSDFAKVPSGQFLTEGGRVYGYWDVIEPGGGSISDDMFTEVGVTYTIKLLVNASETNDIYLELDKALPAATRDAMTLHASQTTSVSEDDSMLPAADDYALTLSSATLQNSDKRFKWTVTNIERPRWWDEQRFRARLTKTAATSTNAAPVFDAAALAATAQSVAENTAADTDIGSAYTATDADDDTLTWSLEGADAASFAIDTSTGQLKTKAALDHETKPSYTVTVKVSDGTASATIAVTVTVTDVNEPPKAPATPTFGTATSDRLEVMWEAPANTGRPDIEDYDLRYRKSGVVTWTDGPQDVAGKGGAIAGLAASTTYEVQVRASNADGPGEWSLSGTAATSATELPAVTLSGPTTVSETDQAAVFTLTRTGATTAKLTVKVRVTEEGDVLANAADYANPVDVEFGIGEVKAKLVVALDDDSAYDPDLADPTKRVGGRVTAAVQAGPGYVPGAVSSVTVAVTDDEDSPLTAALTLEPASPVAESVGTVTVVLTVETKAGGRQPRKTYASTISSRSETASSAEGDFEVLTAQVLVPPSEFAVDGTVWRATERFTIQIHNDDVDEENETFQVITETPPPSDRSNLPATDILTVTIVDDDEVPGAATNLAATPGDAKVTLSWGAPSDAGTSTVTGYQYRVSSDAGNTWGSWTAAGDVREKEIAGLTNGTEYTFEVRAVSAAGDGAAERITGTPAASAAPTVSISATPTSVSETGEKAVFTLARGGPTTAALTVQVQVTQEGDVLDNAADYASPVSVTFGIGSDEETLTVAIDDDLAYDPDLPGAPIGVGGRVTATLQDGTGYTLGSPSTHTVDVIDDENSPLTATFSIDPSPVPEDAGTVTVTVTLATARGGRQPTKAYDYDFTIGSSSSTAEAGVDYSIAADFALPGIISATDYGLEDSVWRASVRRTITILDDDVDEAEKTITVYFENLSVGSQANHVPPDPVTVTIIDDDDVPGAPTNLAATPGDTKVTLGWGAPSDAGTSTVTGYEYRQSSDGGSTWGSWTAAGNVLEKEVTGLTNGTEYTFEVRAVSAAGDGAAERITGTPAAAVTNASATGTVTISDTTPAYGEVLTAAVTNAADGDGLTSPTYSYAWLRGAPGGTPAVIAGADSSTYTPVVADIGQTLQARVSFTDDKSNPETLTSQATAVVTQVVTVSLAVTPTRIFEDAASKDVVATLTMTTEAAAAPTAAISISLYTVDVIASAALDYTAAAEGRIAYAPGDFSLTGDGASYAAAPFTYTVATVRSDSLEEHQPSVETFEVGVRATAGTTLPSWVDLPGVATVTIVDEDTRGLVLTPATLRVVEEDPDGETYTVALRNEPFGTVTVAVSGQGTGLTVTPDSLTFTTTNWRRAQEVTVKAGNDANTVDESVTLTHTTSGTHYDGLTGTVAVTVADNDRAGVSVTGPAEVDESDGEAVFTLTRPGATTAALTVQVQVTEEGDVLDNAADYANPVSVTFGIGSAEETLTVEIDDDLAYDPDISGRPIGVGGRVTAELQAGTGYTLGSPSEHTVDVIDDEDSPLTATFSIDPSPVPEDAGTVTVTVTLATARGGRQPTKAYNYAFENIRSGATAVAGQDYRLAGDFEDDGFVPARDYTQADSVWRATASRSITILDDEVDEADETIRVEFVNYSGGSQANHDEPDPLTVTILDDDEVPGAPTNLAATPGDTKVTLGWGAPSDAGTSTVTGYQYRQSSDGGSTWGSWTDAGDVLEKEVTGLTNGTEYTFEVRAVSAAGDGAAERITGTPAANAAPSFTSSATAEVAENTTAVLTVVATDGDTEDDVTGYTLTGGADQAQFAIDGSSGALTFADAPDYENPTDDGPDNRYVVIVQATSGAGDRALTATQTITVTVTDDDTEAPGAPDAPTFPSATASSLVVNWSAPANAGPAITDYDVRWRVKGSGATWTEADDATPSTDLSATITGLAASTEYEVQVRAQSPEGTSGWSASGDGTTDAAANAAPSFTSSATANVEENTTAVLTVVATDGDAEDDITGYTLTGGADQAQFAIDATSGALTFVTAPDYEDPTDDGPDNTYVVIVQATSGAGDRALTATQTITVTVTDDDTEAPGAPDAPTFPSATASSLVVNWSAPANAGPAIADYDVRWRVKGSGATWTEADDTADSTDLSATITGLAASTEYEVQVRAQSPEGTSGWSASGDGTTNAAANAAPTFTSSATADVAENTTTVLTVVATDSDTADSITGYTLTGGADQAQFAIDGSSGALTFADAPDYENPTDDGPDNRYVVIVQATSGAGDRALTATQTITVTVTDDDTEAPGAPDAPTFPSATASSLVVNWSAPANAGPAITDYDVRWRVKGSGATWTEADDATPSTDLSATITGLAASTEYEVQVRAQSPEGTSGWSASGDGTTDAAANAAPSFTSSATANVEENTTAVLTVVATDGDAEDDITGYTLTGGADQAQFAIDATSGALTFVTAPDYEDPTDDGPDNTYVVIVQATSGAGDRALTATQTITVTVTDDDTEAPGAPDAPTFPSATASSLVVNWSAPANAGPAIADYDVRWRVKGSGATWTEADDTADSTDLSATITGLAASTEYEVQVRAQSPEGTSGWSASGDGTTNAAANAAPTFTSSATADVAENTTTVLTVVATDSDTADSITGYTLTGGADQAQFAIDGSSGALTFADAPDYENPTDDGPDNRYVVIVQATSGAGDRALTATQTITVTVTDDDTEAPGAPDAPTFPSATASSLVVNWSAPANAGPAITDYDVRWRVKGSGATWTEADDATPSTDLSATITGLAASTEYEVQVRAQSPEGTSGWSASGDGTTDAAANAAPSFTSSATANVEENTTAVLTVVATDGDAEDDITGYTLTGGADQAQFAIDATSGALTFVTAPDYEDPTDDGPDNTYVVIVQATSGAGDRALTATQTITVTVTDDDTEAPGAPDAPTFPSATASSLVVNWSAPANAGPAIADYDVRWRVKGSGATWTEADDTADSTDLSATITGLAASTEYEVQVRAQSPEGTSGWSASGDGTTNAAANAAPTFTSSATADVAENTTTVLTVVATDSDTADSITGYTLTGGADQAQFAIDGSSGALTFADAPDYENPTDDGPDNRYVVIVQATSGAGDRALTATQTITVTVTDDDTEAPGAPDAPTFPSATASSLVVNWSAPANAGPAITDYDVRWRVKGSGATWTELADTTDSTARTATITGLAASTEYEVQVRAQNAEGDSEWSASGDGTTNAAANAAPRFTSSATAEVAENTTAVLTVVATDGDAEDDITGYALTGGADQAQFAIDGSSGVLTFATAPNFENPTDAEPYNSYVVIVQATSGAGDRALTATQTITVTVTDDDTEAPGVPDAPTFPSATASGLTVNWAAPANAGPAITGYEVQFREGTSGVWLNWPHSGTGTTATITGLNASTSYQVRVRAQNAEGAGGWSASGDRTTSAAADSRGVTLNPTSLTVNEGGSRTYMVSLATRPTGDVTVTVTGQAGTDLTVLPETMTFTPSTWPNTWQVQVTAGEDTDTVDDTVTLTHTATGADYADVEAALSVTVRDNDPPAVTPVAMCDSAQWSATMTVGGESSRSYFGFGWPITSGDSLTTESFSYDGTNYKVEELWFRVIGKPAYRLGLSAALPSNELNDFTLHVGSVSLALTDAELYDNDKTFSWADVSHRGTFPYNKGATVQVCLTKAAASTNAAPRFTSSATAEVEENTTTVLTVVATDGDAEDSITGYTLTGGSDISKFAIDGSSGALTFADAPDYENPTDVGTNNTYVAIVQATSGTGSREMTATQTIAVTVTDDDTEAPGAPGAPTFPSATASGLTVHWSAPSNAGPAVTDYDVRWRVKGSGATWTELDDTTDSTALSAAIAGLAASTEYEVQVRAENAEGAGEWSASGDRTTSAAANSPATGTVTISDTTPAYGEALTVTVSGVVDGDGVPATPVYSYQWVRVDGSDADIAGATSSSYTPVAADVGKKLKVRVRFTDNASNTETLTSGNTQAVTQDVSVTMSVDPATIGEGAATLTTTLTVKAVTEAAAAPSSNVAFTVVNSGLTATLHDDYLGFTQGNEGVNPDLRATHAAPNFQPSDFAASSGGTTWEAEKTYTLTVVNDVVDEDASETFQIRANASPSTDSWVTLPDAVTVTIADDDEVPGAPTTLVATPGDAKVTLRWGAPSEPGTSTVTGYQYRVSSDAGNTWGSWTDAGNVLEKEISSLTNGTEYTFEVRAVSAAGDGAPSAEMTGTPKAAAPGQVTNVRVTAGVSQLAVSWDAVSGASGYRVQWKSGSQEYDATRQHVVTGGTATSYTIPGLTAGTEYTVRVIATRANAEDGAPSTEMTGTPTAAAPPSAAALSAVVGDNPTYHSTRHTGLSDRPQVVVTFSRAVAAIALDTSSVELTGATLASVWPLGETAAANDWVFYLVPDGAGPIGFTLRTERPCGGSAKGICSADGAVLSSVDGSPQTIPGPSPAPLQTLSAGVGGNYHSADHGGPSDRPQVVVTFNRAVEAIAPDTSSVELTGATLASVWPLGETAAANDWIFYLVPDGTGPITFELLTNRACGGSAKGICSTDGAMLSSVDGSPSVIPGRAAAAAAAAPTVTGAALSAGAAGAGAGEPIEVTVRFSEPVTVDTSGGTPTIGIVAGGAARRAPYARGSGTAALVFAYTVTAADGAVGGARVAENALMLNGGTIRSGAGVDANLAYDLAPAVTAVSVVAPGDDGRWDAGEAAEVAVRFSEAVTVETEGGTPSIGIVVGGQARRALYARGSGTASLVFVYTVAVEDGAIDGVTVPADGLALGGGTIRDRDGKAAVLAHEAAARAAVPVSAQAAQADGPALRVADARAREGVDAALGFTVTLAPAASAPVTVDWATADGTALAGEDYVAANGTLVFAPGETEKTVAVTVLDDAHDEGEESFVLRLSNAAGAELADAEAVGTIVNSDHMPKAWLARFGRTVTGHVLDAVEARLEAPRAAGGRATLAGQALPSWNDDGGASGSAAGATDAAAPHGAPGIDAADRAAAQAVRSWLAGAGAHGRDGGAYGEDGRARFESRALTGREFVTGTSFALTGGSAEGGGFAALWGRGAMTRFDGREGGLTLDGEVTTGLLGADWATERWTAGLALGHSTGTGGYREGGSCAGEQCGGRVEATLTGVYPYAGLTLTDRVSVWAAAGYGAGEVRVTPEGRAAMTADLAMSMGAAGLRSELLKPENGDGLALAVKGDARFTRTSSSTAKTGSMEAADADVWLLRTGIEGARRFALGDGEDGAAVTPSVELGVRLDGGDAETGVGADMGGGLAFADPRRGLVFESRARGLIAHEASGFREWGASVSFAYRPRPETERGLALSLTQSWGASPTGGMDALLGRETLAGLAANDDGGRFEASSRLEGELGYGVAAFGGAFTGTPNIGFGLSDNARDVRLGWRLTSAVPGDPGFEVSLDATRRETANDDTPAEHGIMLRAVIRW